MDYSNGSAYKLSPEELQANMVAVKPKVEIPNDPGAILLFDKPGNLVAVVHLED